MINTLMIIPQKVFMAICWPIKPNFKSKLTPFQSPQPSPSPTFSKQGIILDAKHQSHDATLLLFLCQRPPQELKWFVSNVA